MLTWTTYGTWLQGDDRGYVKEGKRFGEKKVLVEANANSQVCPTVRLTQRQKEIVAAALAEQGALIGQELCALAVFSNHVHIVVRADGIAIGDAVRYYKKAGYFALRKTGFRGRLWARGYDKRFCYDEGALRSRIAYVRRHED